MEWYWVLALVVGSLIGLMLVGVPVGFAFLITNTAAAFVLYGRYQTLDRNLEAAVYQLSDNAFHNLAQFALVPLPMFVLMGDLFFQLGLATRMFNAIERVMGQVPARLSYVTIAGGTAFATLSGSSMASTALLGRLLVPEMTRRGYKNILSIGPILGTGGLAILIPPSALAVLLGTIAQIDIGRLLIGGIVPGLVLSAMYAGLVFSISLLDPKAAPAYDIDSLSSWERLRLIAFDVVPMVGVIAFVVAAILFGIATPSESAAFGTIAVILLGIGYLFLPPLFTAIVTAASSDGGRHREAVRQAAAVWPFMLRAIRESLWGSARITVMVLMILFGASLFSNVLAGTGASEKLVAWILGFQAPPTGVVIIAVVLVLGLGVFMDQIGIMLLTVPIFFPVIAKLDFGMPKDQVMIWFGVLMLLALEIGLTTPPFGLLLFVMQGVAPRGTTFGQIAAAAVPYFACAVALLFLIIWIPALTVWLPFLGK